MYWFQNKEYIANTQTPYWYTIYPPWELTQDYTLVYMIQNIMSECY